MDQVNNFWTTDTSVLFTSFWGWSPETWGTVGWSNTRGLTRRMNLLKEMTDPFITVCYVTSNKTYIDPALKGMIAGFYLVSHETGDRDQFTHPIHHDLDPEKWRHSLKSLRAFSYLPEYRLSVSDLNPALLNRALSVSAMGEIISDPHQIKLLRDTPWVEVDVYQPPFVQWQGGLNSEQQTGKVRAGPENIGGYQVPHHTDGLSRELYVLHLSGDADAYLGRSSDNRSIYKIGLSVSPEIRRQSFQKSMPRGAFHWRIEKTTSKPGHAACLSFFAAVAGENAMKDYLAACAEWLGGEFYLATAHQIEEAWQQGNFAAKEYKDEY
ncbi:MAG: hypothetical protein P1V21_02820 [Rhizobiaceae bacterium]|nr:hypothetical protein [Rhizobiaceae bacterium]